jgi:hypothetical protein
MHNILRARVLAINNGFGLEKLVFRNRYRLIDLNIGHLIKDGETGLPTFTTHRACVVLRSIEQGA